ncbi:MAG: amino acid ABC transporter substrate-binding protein [Burkholderiales bacterium]|nr:amino acid ABC transporter substrate-binding protein [Burkholderiales bacterium]
MASAGHAQALTGTLKKAWDTGAVTLGYRASSVPFSYLSARGEPIGYAIDICRALVASMEDALGRELVLRWQPVTAESRMQAVSSGQVDMECGSTTHNVEREKQVAFSPVTFVSGTKLMVRKGSALRSFRDLVGKRVVVTDGTTNEKTMRALSDKFKLGMQLVVAHDHAESFAELKAGQVDAFATDDVLLYGLLAQNKAQADFVVVGEFLSYDPYGIMFRKDDAALAQLVDQSFRRQAEEGDLERLYTRWFLRPLPSGPGINLPMSPQLATIFQSLVSKPE